MNNDFVMSSIFCILLTISELLPYMKNIKSNGIIELIINFCIFLLKNEKDESETEHLLENFLEERLNEIGPGPGKEICKANLTDLQNTNNLQNTNLTFTSQNITITFNSPNEIKTS